MNVEVDETSIDQFNLVELTGNPREELLSRAAEARESGYTLTVKIPDSLIHLNIFDSVEGEEVEEPANLRCRYKPVVSDRHGDIWVCVIHGEQSKYLVNEESTHPCLKLDPL